ncbi:type III pantothenate kinase [soil metagenome]
MLLAVDIGNTNIKFGVFDNENLVAKLSLPTNRDLTAEAVSKVLSHRLTQDITAAIVCSVVPEVRDAVSRFVSNSYNIDPIWVSNDLDYGLKIIYEPLAAAGTDRIVNSFAAAEKYGVPCVVCSFGTATTIDVVSSARELLGGMIAPGFRTMSTALRLMTSNLPEVGLQKPENILGNTTIESIRSGIYFSQLGFIESAIARISAEIGAKPFVVATGGFANEIAADTTVVDKVDELLTLDGLRMLYSQKRAH